ncbi:Acetyltransferase (GNAT) family protein [Paenibacillus sp. BC26]|nr:Acetyltransferase (GNAT) family protein [Paenibacillus sp. BC26]
MVSVVETIKVIKFESTYNKEVKQLILSVLSEYGFSFHSEWDSDLDNIEATYSGRSGFWIAVDGSKIIGTSALLEYQNNNAILKRMYLSRTYRGKGIGYRLLDEAISFARTKMYSEILLDTTRTMVQAQKLYTAFGFIKTKEQDELIIYKLKLK